MFTRALVLATTVLAACGDTDPGGPYDFLFADRGIIEHVPAEGGGGPDAETAWTARADADGLVAAIDLVDTTLNLPPMPMGSFPLVDGSLVWSPWEVEPGFYRFRATILDGNDPGAPDLGRISSPAIDVVQGVRFPDVPATLTAPADLVLTISNASTIDLEVTATIPSNPPVRHVLARLSVASDLAPIARIVSCCARDADGMNIPPNRYRLLAEVTTEDGTRYVDAGPTVDWQPSAAR